MHDILIDAIRKDGNVVWDGEIPKREFAFPGNVNSCYGVSFVRVMKYDPVGHFLSRGVPVSYIKFNCYGVSGRVCR